MRIVDFAYTAQTLRVHAGTRVTWRNADTTNHTVTFRKAGCFTYVCEFHPFMRGTVVVSR